MAGSGHVQVQDQSVDMAERQGQLFRVVGHGVAAVDAHLKVSGKAQYVADLRLPGMLVGKILRSLLAHARIVHIDVSKARRVPGVKAVVTFHDSPRLRYNSSNRFPSDLEFLPQDRLILDNVVRHVGDRVAAVAAVDEDTAREALELIRVDYEELPAVFDPEEAMCPGAPVIHEAAPDNVARRIEICVGDIEEGFRQADFVFEGRYTTQAVQQATLEPHACVADYSDGKVVIWSCTQVPFMVRQLIAQLFGLPMSAVRVIKPHVGGAFGGKDELFEEPVCALLSKQAGRPVLLEVSREEEFYRNRRHPAVLELKTGVTRDGILVARYLRAITNTGAYACAGPKITFAMGEKWATLYRCPNIKYEGYCVYTNTPPSGAFRGYGNPQSNFALESQMDEIAAALGMDPLEVRLKNHIREGDIHPVAKTVVVSCGLPECLRRGAEKIGWERRTRAWALPRSQDDSCERLGSRDRGYRRGIGVACAIHGSSLAPYGREIGSASVRINEDGTVSLGIGAADTGQGANTILAQIAAEELGVPLDAVKVSPVDTDISPIDIGDCGSRTTFVVGNAVRLAARDAKEQLLQIASEMLRVPAADLTVRDGTVFARDGRAIPVREIAHHARYVAQRVIAAVSSYVPPHTAPPFAAVFAEVEVDLATGVVKVLRLVAAQDVGRAINPRLIEGQMQGAQQIGLGLALGEKLWIDARTGRIVNASFLEYGAAGPLDMPKIETIIVESIEPDGPFGAKSVGEVGSVPVAAAIANAVYDATGLRIRDLPITPAKILAALHATGGRKA